MTLTREQVLEMGAGREMDSLIAERVMKWYITKGEYSGKEYWNDSDDYSHYSLQGFNPSTHILAAWEVLEKMNNEGCRVLVNVADEKDGEVIRGRAISGEWHSNIVKSGERHNHAYAETAPLAICRAALLSTIA